MQNGPPGELNVSQVLQTGLAEFGRQCKEPRQFLFEGLIQGNELLALLIGFLVGQAVGRKRNQSDVRAGLSKAFGRRTEKLRQQVGLSEMYEDREYDALADKFGERFLQLQLVVRDVQDYVESTKRWMIQFNELASTIEGYLDVHHSPYLELDSKWRRFRMLVRDIVTNALPEHVSILSSDRPHITTLTHLRSMSSRNLALTPLPR